jgi:transcriptional regulator with XRE-family HTH domain
MEFSQYLTYLRERSGLTKRDLANKVDVDETYISNFEHGRNKPPGFELCKKIAQALKLEMAEKKKFFAIAMEERLGEDIGFLDEIKDSNYVKQETKELEAISKEILDAIEDPVAVKALLITYRNTEDIRRHIKQLLDSFTKMDPEKRKAILALCG